MNWVMLKRTVQYFEIIVITWVYKSAGIIVQFTLSEQVLLLSSPIRNTYPGCFSFRDSIREFVFLISYKSIIGDDIYSYKYDLVFE